MNDFMDNTIAGDSGHFDATISRKNALKSKTVYFVSKRVFDLVISIAALPVFGGLCAVIYVLNFFWNPGPLFFFQERMGKDQSKYVMIKFRTMLPEDKVVKRGPFDKLEKWRITSFGRWMRLTRLDEVPQFLNIIMGHMSLIGPRPEIFEFAKTYHKEMPGYHMRGSVRPGITGYSQVKQGYTDSEEAIRLKTKLDTFYVRNMNWWLDLKIIFWTVRVIFNSHGAK